MMIHLLRTDSNNKDFQYLVNLLDKHLHILNGNKDVFFAQYNKIDALKHTIVAYQNNIPVGCGAIKEYEYGIAEVKRMYVLEDKRGLGIATKVLMELEKWAAELGYTKCILETSIHLASAVSLYKSNNYKSIPNYGQYKGIENSICFEKVLKQ
jgi:GNAT superfamily N-acetyltransferase